jgi:hypothetical protein
MSYDEPPEPTEEEIAEHQARVAALKTPIRIEGLTMEAVESVLRGLIQAECRITERLESKLEEAVDEHVSKLVDTVTRERIEKAVDAAIAEGFPIFDTYSGRETGRTSVGELVHKYITRREDRGYNEKGTVAEIAVMKAVKELFEKTLAGELEKLKADFKKQADGVFQAKIVASLKEAMGLRS